jgi:hypothetical protein
MIVAAVVIGVMVLLVAPLWKRDKGIRFWTVGCLLSTLLMCTTFPHDRLLTGIGIGAMALVAEVLASVARSAGLIDETETERAAKWTDEGRSKTAESRGMVAPTLPNALWVKVAAAALVFVHLVMAPVLSPYRARAMIDVNRMLDRADRTVPSDPSVSQRTVVLVNPPLDPFAGYFLIYRAARGQPRPKHLRWLATGVTDLRIERVDDRTLRIRPKAGFLSDTSQMMLRSPAHPMHSGEQIALSDATIEVSDLGPDGRALEILVHFKVKLEDASLQWLQWGDHGYVPFRLPEVGETVVLPAANMREVLFG